MKTTTPEVHAAHMALGREVMALDQLETRVHLALHTEIPMPDEVTLPARWATAVETVQLTLAWIDMESRQ